MRLRRGWRRGRRAKVGAVGGVVVVGVEREVTQLVARDWRREHNGETGGESGGAGSGGEGVDGDGAETSVGDSGGGSGGSIGAMAGGFVRGSAGRWVARAGDDNLSAAGLSGGSGSYRMAARREGARRGLVAG